MRKLCLFLVFLLCATPVFAAGLDSYVVFLTNCDGADESTSFTDQSDTGHTITASGNAQVDTTAKKFGTGSLLLDGDADFLYSADHADFAFGSSNFVIDLWVYFGALGEQQMVAQSADGDNRWNFQMSSTNQMMWHMQTTGGGTLLDVRETWGPSTSTWYHAAFVRSGNDWYMFSNGTQLGTEATDSDAAPDIAAQLRIGAYFNTAQEFNGQMDEVRISTGTDRDWTSNFTPPTEAYSAVSTRGRLMIIAKKFTPRKDGNGYDRHIEKHWYTHKDVKL